MQSSAHIVIPRTVLPSCLLLASGWFAAAEIAAAECPDTSTARQLLKEGRYPDAEKEARELLAAAEQVHGPDSAQAACAIDELVESLWRGGKSREEGTRELAERGVEIAEGLGAPNEILARSLRSLALVLEDFGDNGAARTLLERSVAMVEEVLGPEHRELGRTLNSLGWLLYVMGEYDEARLRYDRALEVYRRSGVADHPDVAGILNNTATVYWREGRYDEALPLYERALAIREASLPPNHPSLARSVENLGIVLYQMGDYAAARPYYERAIAMRERSLGADHPELANNLGNYAALLSKLGDHDGARIQERVLAIFEKTYGPEHRNVALALGNLALYLAEVGDCEEAVKRAERSVAVYEKSMGPGHPDVATGLGALAAARECSGDHAGAVLAYERQMEALEAAHGPDHPFIANPLERLADLYFETGDNDRALDYATRSLNLQMEHLGPVHADVAISLTRLAGISWARGARAETLAYARQAAGLVLEHMRDTLASLPERQALLLTKSRPNPEFLLFSGLLTAGDDEPAWRDAAWAWTLGRRGIVLEELAARHRAAGSGATPEVVRAREGLARARENLAGLWVRAVRRPGDSGDEEIARARELKERAETELARLSDDFRRALEERAADMGDVRSALPPASAVAEIVQVEVRPPGSRRGEPHDVALILLPDGPRRPVDLGPSRVVSATVAGWREALEESGGRLEESADVAPIEEALAATGSRLREIAWDPIARELGEIETVFFVPDGSLHTVDLRALPASAGGYLIEHRPRMHLLGSARDLVRLARDESATAGRGLLVLGAPDFDADETIRIAQVPRGAAAAVFRGAAPACAELRKTTWQPLPESAREARRIGAHAAGGEQTVLLMGAAASEERLKREAPGKRVLHLATHGFFLQDDCGGAEASSSSPGPSPEVVDNPLLLSGLVLAGANRAGEPSTEGEDGILTAEELAALDLAGVELAVLSACDTGKGTVAPAEGVFGLRRAVELAGARTVVMSLWQVPDRQALRWMTTFYEQRAKGSSIIDASHRAGLDSLEWLRSRGWPTHPYLWAGFVAAGDWR